MNKLSVELKVPASTICRLETGKRKPTFNIAEKLADYFKVNMETFKMGKTY